MFKLITNLKLKREEAVKRLLTNESLILQFPTGVGKTAMVLEFLQKKQPKNAIIVAPLSVAKENWQSQLKDFPALEEKYEVIFFHGKDKKRIDDQSGKIIIVNYEGVKRFLEMHLERFDVVIFDESTKAKTFENIVNTQCCMLSKQCNQRILLTGTFVSTGALDLYGQIALLDEKILLGNRFRKHSNWIYHYFKCTDYFKKMYEIIDKKSYEIFKEQILPYMICVSDDVLQEILPPIRFMERQYELTFEQQSYLSKSDDINYKLQICSGFFYKETAQGFEELPISPKKRLFFDILLETSNENRLICYKFVAEISIISKCLEYLGEDYRVLKGTDKDFSEVVSHWNDGKIKNLIISPASTAYGTNLQHGGNTIIWFTINGGFEKFKQTNARLYRRGQKNTVKVYILIGIATVEEAIFNKIQKMRKIHEKFTKQ